MKKYFISIIGVALILVGCSNAKSTPQAVDVMNYFKGVYTSKALKDVDFTGYEFTDKTTKRYAMDLAEDIDAGSDSEFLALKESAFKAMYNAVEYHVGEIVEDKKKENVYTATMYIAPIDFSYYNSENVQDILNVYDRLVEEALPELSAPERFDIVTEILDNKKTNLTARNGDKINLFDLVSYYSVSMVLNDIIDNKNSLVLTNTVNRERSDSFVPTYFEVEFKFSFNDDKIVPISLGSEDATDLEELLTAINKQNLHFATSSEVEDEKENNPKNFIKGKFNEKLFKDTEENK